MGLFLRNETRGKSTEELDPYVTKQTTFMGTHEDRVLYLEEDPIFTIIDSDNSSLQVGVVPFIDSDGKVSDVPQILFEAEAKFDGPKDAMVHVYISPDVLVQLMKFLDKELREFDNKDYEF